MPRLKALTLKAIYIQIYYPQAWLFFKLTTYQVIQERLSPCKYPYENMYWEMSNLLGILSKQKLYSNSFSSDNVTYTQNNFSRKV